jgi:HlyD family secretion protein
MLQAQTNRLNPILLWAGGIVFVLLSIWGLRSLLRDRLPIVAAKVSYQDLVNTIPTNGKVVPDFSFEAHAPFAGTVSKVYVQQGDVVPKGKLLLTLGDDDARARLATATSNLRTAQAALDALQNGGTQDDRIRMDQQITQAQMQVTSDTRTLADVKALMASGAASQSEVNTAQGRLAIAENNLSALRQRKTSDYSAPELARVRAQLADAKAAYDVAQSVLDSAHVTAPFDGTVYSISVSGTNYVTDGQELLKMADLTHLRVLAYFDEPDIGKLAVGQPVKITWDAKPGLSWNGHVERQASSITNYGTRNVGEVMVTVDDPPGPLLPNTNVMLKVTNSVHKNVLGIPRGALFTEGPVNFVYKVADDRLVRTTIQVGELNLTNVEVTGGLKENDVVALRANSSEPLADGAEIKIVK